MEINYPENFDTDSNLFVARDNIKFTLAEDYHPGDLQIEITGNPDTWVLLPSVGIITLTDQCNEITAKGISFLYTKNSDTTNGWFLTVALLDGYPDVFKPKRLTSVSLSVVAEHHRQLKDALIAIENFIGIAGTIDLTPMGETLEGRINFLRKLVLSPKAYFVADKKIGLVPLTVKFTDLSFRLGTDGTTGTIVYHWDFGDGTISDISNTPISTFSNISSISLGCDESELIETNLIGSPVGTTVEKTYCEPGIYDVSLTVSNQYGSDTIVLNNMIQARVEAPEEAKIEFIPNAGTQLLTADGIRTQIGSLVTIQVPSGVDPDRPGYSYAGEKLNSGNNPIDPITSYTWRLSDDLTHSTSSNLTRAAYSVGGEFDVKVRVDTQYGAFRITSMTGAIDVVERQNLWMFLLGNDGVTVTPYEYGLLSETFKVGENTLAIDRDESFLTGLNGAAKQKQEFRRNVGFAQIGTTFSGNQGTAVLYHATGRNSVQSPAIERIDFANYNGFGKSFSSEIDSINRPWNWAEFHSPTNLYFLLGNKTTPNDPFTSPTNSVLTDFNLTSLTSSNTTWDASYYQNGSDDLMTNAGYISLTNYDNDGKAKYGDFSTYRTTWKDSTGYMLRNSAVGDFFRIRSFYSTEGTIGSPVNNMTRLTDIDGPIRVEGQLLTMNNGLYFFDNSGSISVYKTSTFTWQSGGAGSGSPAFRELQDQTVSGYDSLENRLMAASDGDKRAYLSYDYSETAFIKFNSTDTTFSSLNSRPVGTQWNIGVY